VTLAAKQLRTVHRLVLSGSPMQNRLQEMWSLFDFAFPGKLGTLPVFTAQFALPITAGGYVGATPLQVQAAYRCAVVLRDLVAPYLLRRLKADVLAGALPPKTERVVFCGLGPEQRALYRAYLASGDVADILAGRRNALQGLDILRKICNHPDLLERTTAQGLPDYGAPERSGKLTVAARVLEHWLGGVHKALVFTQTQQMLDIMERLAVARQWRYHRMDGATPVPLRARLMADFNRNPHVQLFLLTTKVGGLGVNLTGADRVLVYDADWNPATDAQARERAWRIGQGRPVTVYRLVVSGTVEEKVYHRQVYKNYLTARVLKDPRQRRFFAARDISDLLPWGTSTPRAAAVAHAVVAVAWAVARARRQEEEPAARPCRRSSSSSRRRRRPRPRASSAPSWARSCRPASTSPRWRLVETAVVETAAASRRLVVVMAAATTATRAC
jgi:DNA excision repair protein ERCC-6